MVTVFIPHWWAWKPVQDHGRNMLIFSLRDVKCLIHSHPVCDMAAEVWCQFCSVKINENILCLTNLYIFGSSSFREQSSYNSEVNNKAAITMKIKAFVLCKTLESFLVFLLFWFQTTWFSGNLLKWIWSMVLQGFSWTLAAFLLIFSSVLDHFRTNVLFFVK